MEQQLPPDHSHSSESDNELSSCEWLLPKKDLRAQDANPAKPYYVYLMACTLPTERTRRMFTHIGKSREPVRKVIRHNAGLVNSGKRSTRASAPHWKLEEWIGPFASRAEARGFQKDWFRNTKGIKPRLERGVHLANAHRRVCYTPRTPLGERNVIVHTDNTRFVFDETNKENEVENAALTVC